MTMAGAARDLWIQWAVFLALGVTIIAGLVKLFSARYISTPLAISILWALYNIVPPALVGPPSAVRRTLSAAWQV